ncbi:hypothetical protein EDB83DRAFT_2555375 [Lactarius deliciosus]|nr:hypothetical protein EDB83DRAFT_2555375 [Lactarius deliciosus]
MSANEGRNGAGLLDSASQAVSSSNRRAPGLAANLNYRLPSVHPNSDQGDGPSVEMRDSPPPLGVKLTCYRLLNVTTGISFVALTAVLAYKNLTVAAATVGLVSGLFAIGLSRVGLYERRPGRNWFFQDDLVPIFVRGDEPYFLYGVGIDANEQTRSYTGSVLSLRRAYWGTAIISIGLTFPVVVILMGLVVGATSKRKSRRGCAGCERAVVVESGQVAHPACVGLEVAAFFAVLSVRRKCARVLGIASARPTLVIGLPYLADITEAISHDTLGADQDIVKSYLEGFMPVISAFSSCTWLLGVVNLPEVTSDPGTTLFVGAPGANSLLHRKCVVVQTVTNTGFVLGIARIDEVEHRGEAANQSGNPYGLPVSLWMHSRECHPRSVRKGNDKTKRCRRDDERSGPSGLCDFQDGHTAVKRKWWRHGVVGIQQSRGVKSKELVMTEQTWRGSKRGWRGGERKNSGGDTERRTEAV